MAQPRDWESAAHPSVLVVEDSRIIRRLSSQMFASLGFTVRQAENGEVAKARVAEAMPTLVLLDWHMPLVNGIDFLRWLRTEAEGGDRPIVIFCTTETHMDYITEAIEAGANDYMMKPFDVRILESKLALLGFA